MCARRLKELDRTLGYIRAVAPVQREAASMNFKG